MPNKTKNVTIKKSGNKVQIEVLSSLYYYNGKFNQEKLEFEFESQKKKKNKDYENKGEELMALHQAFYKQINPIQFVLRGAKLRCTHSSDNTYILLDTVEDFGIYSYQHAIMTCSDCKVGENIFNFGLCGNKLNKPEYSDELPHPTKTGIDKKGNIRHVCVPLLADEWVIGDRGSNTWMYIDKETYEIEQFREAVLTDASLLCLYGGTITIEENPEVDEEIIIDEGIETEDQISDFEYDWMKEIPGKEKYVTEDALRKVVEISTELQINPDDLMAVMAFESWLNPHIQNSTGACGLIQFTQIAIDQINKDNNTKYTKESIKQMDMVEQLDVVYLYLKPHAGKMKDLGDVYVAVLASQRLGQENIYSKKDSSKNYENNKGLDSNNDGIITKAEATQRVIDRRDAYYGYDD